MFVFTEIKLNVSKIYLCLIHHITISDLKPLMLVSGSSNNDNNNNNNNNNNDTYNNIYNICILTKYYIFYILCII